MLARFAPHDAATNNHLAVVDGFRDACDRYVDVRARRELNRQGRLIACVFGSLDDTAIPCNNNNTNTTLHHRQGQEQNQDRNSPINNDLDISSTSINNEPLQGDTPFFHIPSPPGYSYADIGIDASGTLDSEVAPLSAETLQASLDCYGYDVDVDVNIEWPLVSVDASA